MKVTAGDRIRIIGGLLDGLEAVVMHVNLKRGSVTAAVRAGDIVPENRKKFFVHRNGYIPIEVLEEEFESIGTKIITYGEG